MVTGDAWERIIFGNEEKLRMQKIQNNENLEISKN
jgi:hypothetical protein